LRSPTGSPTTVLPIPRLLSRDVNAESAQRDGLVTAGLDQSVVADAATTEEIVEVHVARGLSVDAQSVASAAEIEARALADNGLTTDATAKPASGVLGTPTDPRMRGRIVALSSIERTAVGDLRGGQMIASVDVPRDVRIVSVVDPNLIETVMATPVVDSPVTASRGLRAQT